MSKLDPFKNRPDRIWDEKYQKWIEVGYLDEPPQHKARAEKRARRQKKAFVMIPLAADAAKVTRTQGALVWILLLYTAWKTNNQTFPLPNTVFAKYGVRRDTKCRILRALEASGRIKIKWQNGRALIVTLIELPS
jgi:hypothetical protein